MQKTYLALVNSNFDLTNEVEEYFEQAGITILKYYPRLCILHLVSELNLIENRPKYVEYIEFDQSKHANQSAWLNEQE